MTPRTTALLPQGPGRGSLGDVFALDSDRTTSLMALCAAVGLHAALALGASTSGSAPPAPVIVSEVELAPSPPPPPEPEPEPEPEAVRPAAAAPAAPAAARAGRILAATPAPAAKADDLVDFVSDPAGTSYGSGVVARGGTAERSTGVQPRVVGPPGPARTAPAGDGITPAANLQRAAKLSADDPCKGQYPGEASVDSGAASVSVVVSSAGKVMRATLVSESPSGQGFGAAARRCLASTSFSPAIDKGGNAATAQLTVSVRFTR